MTVDGSKYVEELTAMVRAVHDEARKTQERQIAARNKNKNKDRVQRSFHAGNFVMWILEERRDKLQPVSQGPYKVVECVTGGMAYVRQTLVNPAKVATVHFSKLLPFTCGEGESEAMMTYAALDEREQLIEECSFVSAFHPSSKFFLLGFFSTHVLDILLVFLYS